MDIRELSRDNLIDAIKIGFEFWTETPIYNKYEFDNERAFNFLINIIDTKESCGFLAYSDDKVVGSIMGSVQKMYFSDLDVLGEYYFYVSPNKRGSSAAYKLFKAWEKFGKDNNADTSLFNIGTGINPERAVGFVEKMGFSPIGQFLWKENKYV